MVGGPLIEHVRGVLEVRSCRGFGVVSASIHPVLHILRCNLIGRLSYGFLPEFVRLGEDGKAVFSVFRGVGVSTIHCGKSAGRRLLLYHACLVERFIDLVPYLAERVHQTTSLNDAGHHHIAVCIAFELFFQDAVQRYIPRSNNLFHLVDNAVDGGDVAVAHIDGIDAVDVDAVRVFGAIDAEFDVVHVGPAELVIVLLGETHRLIDFLVASVDDAVIDDDAHDAVAQFVAREAVP